MSVCLSVCLCVCVSFRRYTRRRLWSDQDQILHTHADSSPNGSELNKNQPRVTQGGLGGFRGSEIQKYGVTTKTAGPIGTKFGAHNMRIYPGMDIS